MIVVIRDIFWNYHYFYNSESVHNFMRKYEKDFDFIFKGVYGNPFSTVEIHMIFRDSDKAKQFCYFMDLKWELEEEDYDESK